MIPEAHSGDLYDGFGTTPTSELQLLVKALEAQEQTTDIASLQSVGALQAQSLETTLALLTFSDKHLTLWKDIPKSKAFSVLEEYSVQTGYGQEGAFMQQMETPLEGDPAAKRQFAYVKFIRALWKASDVSGLVRTITDSETWAKRSAMMRLLRQVNRNLYSGDSDIIPEGFDGFYKKIHDTNYGGAIVDCRGGIPTQDHFNQMAQQISLNYGNVDGLNIYSSAGGLSTLTQILRQTGIATDSAQRIMLQIAQDGSLALGNRVQQIHTPWGTMIPKQDIFIGQEYENHAEPYKIDPTNQRATTLGPTSARAPVAPTVTSALVADASTKWLTGEYRPAGVAYRHKVYAVNRYGASTATAATTARIPVSDTSSIQLTITPGASLFPETGYVILGETQANSGLYRWIGFKAATGAAVTFTDDNSVVPGTTHMFALDLTPNGEYRTTTMSLLAPIHAKEYARVGEFRWGTLNYYAAMKYYADGTRFGLIKNVRVPNAPVNKLMLV